MMTSLCTYQRANGQIMTQGKTNLVLYQAWTHKFDIHFSCLLPQWFNMKNMDTSILMPDVYIF